MYCILGKVGYHRKEGSRVMRPMHPWHVKVIRPRGFASRPVGSGSHESGCRPFLCATSLTLIPVLYMDQGSALPPTSISSCQCEPYVVAHSLLDLAIVDQTGCEIVGNDRITCLNDPCFVRVAPLVQFVVHSLESIEYVASSNLPQRKSMYAGLERTCMYGILPFDDSRQRVLEPLGRLTTTPRSIKPGVGIMTSLYLMLVSDEMRTKNGREHLWGALYHHSAFNSMAFI